MVKKQSFYSRLTRASRHRAFPTGRKAHFRAHATGTPSPVPTQNVSTRNSLLPWSASTTGVASKPERADPSASEATREPGSDALKCVPPLRANTALYEKDLVPAVSPLSAPRRPSPSPLVFGLSVPHRLSSCCHRAPRSR